MTLAPSFATAPRSVIRLLEPRSIAIVGASADPRSFGGFVLANLERFGYAGAIHLVSRSSAEINARACVKTVDELPQGIDVAVLAIPEGGVLDAVRACAVRGVAVVIYAPATPRRGRRPRKQEQLAEIATPRACCCWSQLQGFPHFEARACR